MHKFIIRRVHLLPHQVARDIYVEHVVHLGDDVNELE
jgi:hypothetical protein